MGGGPDATTRRRRPTAAKKRAPVTFALNDTASEADDEDDAHCSGEGGSVVLDAITVHPSDEGSPSRKRWPMSASRFEEEQFCFAGATALEVPRMIVKNQPNLFNRFPFNPEHFSLEDDSRRG